MILVGWVGLARDAQFRHVTDEVGSLREELRCARARTEGLRPTVLRAQLQRRQQAEGGMQLRDVSREVHGQEYNGFYLGAQPKRLFELRPE